jgi:lipopolysaccharide transport system ATP-binding protein
MKNVIEIKNLSKVYDLGLVGTGTLSKDLNRMWAKLRGRPDPYAQLVELNDRTQKSSSNMVYALKDINFSVKQGEVLGIIGKNGAGKSTLLKILSQITSPSTGTIKMKGRVASLLEVGTGMHPEMTARQNIYLNGSLMGMRRHEITAKLEEIVSFAGVEKYIDTPTKRFSSGMKVRLGFAVAAFLEPEILIVDEVLAVGDAEFQNKAIGKMKEISKGEGRSVLFVSHNLGSVQSLCNKAICIDKGMITYQNKTDKVIQYYLGLDKEQESTSHLNLEEQNIIVNRTGPKNNFKLKKIKLKNHLNNLSAELLFGKKINIEIEFTVAQKCKKTEIGIGINSAQGISLGGFASNWNNLNEVFEEGTHAVNVTIPFLYLVEGKYQMSVWIKEQGQKVDDQIARALTFTIIDSDMNGRKTNIKNYKHLNLTFPTDWTIIK